MDGEQIDQVANWTTSNPAYELFCIQAEVHHHHQHQQETRSPSPDNTDAQIPDMVTETAMEDGDNDSLNLVNNLKHTDTVDVLLFYLFV